MQVLADNDRRIVVTPDSLSDAVYRTFCELDGFAPMRASMTADYDLHAWAASVARHMLISLVGVQVDPAADALAAIVDRSGGRLYDTDQETGETFHALACAALGR